jgi:predicted RNA binding protein YcfA (HicA-like mRNA interferase family)
VKQISGNEFGMVLKKQKWELARIRGSHHIFAKPGRIERISVPVHGNKPLKVGLLRSLMKMADVDESDL